MHLNPETQLVDGRKLLAWWANNAGRGTDNCTLAVVPATTPRAAYSRNQTDVIATTRTSSWKGDVNLSRAVCSRLGIDQPDPEPSKYDDDDYTDT